MGYRLSAPRRAAQWLLAICLAAASMLTVPPTHTANARDPQTPADVFEHPFLTGEDEGQAASVPFGVLAATPSSGFSDNAVLGGLDQPTAVDFAADGRVFVTEKSGRLMVYDSLSDSSPSVVADLRTETNAYWDRGMTGLALAPDFPADPSVYLLYTYDALPGGSAPAWNDDCPNPPGATTDGCVVMGRLTRLSVNASSQVTDRQDLIVDQWCQQFPSHSVDDLVFGPDGYLYLSAGDGASFNTNDYGQLGGSQAGTPTPANPCGDPPGGVGTALTPPTATGGSLRAQSPRRSSGQPRSLDGAILRIDPETGLGAPGNPFAASSDANAKRIVGYGLRNPFRIAFRPGTSELWIGDVGEGAWEEINVLEVGGAAPNFGWPCFEGEGVHGGFGSLTLCSSLAASATVEPHFAYPHSGHVVSGDGCATGSSALSGVAFYDGGTYPDAYDGALFFGDYARNCIWVMFPDGSGVPDPSNVQAFESPSSYPADLTVGPGGDLFYADIVNGSIHRISYQAPHAVATASPTSGPAPLTVSFDGSGSTSGATDPSLTYAWDLDGDGQFDDSSLAKPSRTYSTPGAVNVRLRVTNALSISAVSEPIVINPANSAPSASVLSVKVGGTTYAPVPAFMTGTPPVSGIAPESSRVWTVGSTITVTGSATDGQDGTLSGSDLTWTLTMRHCPAGVNCHSHQVQSSTGTSITFSAPDHEWPSYLRLTLKATDSGGLSAERDLYLYPRSAEIHLSSSPAGAAVRVDGVAANVEAIVGHTASLSAPATATLGGEVYRFSSWSDGSTATTRSLVVPATDRSLVARYVAALDRLSGGDRYETAVQISRDAFPSPGSGVPLAYVATGTTFPDALAAAAAAGMRNAPVLLTLPGSIPSSVRAELVRLKPQRILVLGGANAIGAGVFSQLADLAGSGGARRLSGGDRYETAVQISRDAFPSPGSGVPLAYVATGTTFPDALAAAAAAGMRNAPVLLTLPGSIPSSVRAELVRLKPQRILVLGGANAIGAGVFSQLEGLLGP